MANPTCLICYFREQYLTIQDEISRQYLRGSFLSFRLWRLGHLIHASRDMVEVSTLLSEAKKLLIVVVFAYKVNEVFKNHVPSCMEIL